MRWLSDILASGLILTGIKATLQIVQKEELVACGPLATFEEAVCTPWPESVLSTGVIIEC